MDNIQDKIRELGVSYECLNNLVQITDDVEILIRLMATHFELLDKIGQLAYDLAYDVDNNVDINTFTTSLLGIGYVWNDNDTATLLGGDFVLMQELFKEGKFNR